MHYRVRYYNILSVDLVEAVFGYSLLDCPEVLKLKWLFEKWIHNQWMQLMEPGQEVTKIRH